MPYIPHTEADVRAMLDVIGAESIDELFREIPENLRLRETLDIPSHKDEYHLYQHLVGLARQNKDATQLDWYLGAGLYDRYIPQTVPALISRGEFLTAYTPYQPELSQGYLQTIYEFQSMVAELLGVDVANASMYDGSTALAEAAFMATGITGRTRLVVSDAIHPHWRQVLETYAWANSLTVDTVSSVDGQTTDWGDLSDAAAVLVQTPNFFGVLEDVQAARRQSKDAGAQLIVATDPIACALLPPPGELGADMVVAEGQPLGVAMGFGGPLVGLFGCRQDLVRRIPGRIVGRTTDQQGREGYTMTLRTREQDIRREKATSNICTNEALMALAATIYLTALGKNGLESIAESTVQNTQYALGRLQEAGAKRTFPGRVFGEFVVTLPKSAVEVRDALIDRKIMAGLPLGEYYGGRENDLLVAVTEVRTKDQIDRFAHELADVLR